MSSAVSLPNHTFTGQAKSSKWLTSIVHILLPETDNYPSWISRRERMTVENISWSTSTKECCRPRRGLNPRPPGLQSDGASNWATEAGNRCLVSGDRCLVDQWNFARTGWPVDWCLVDRLTGGLTLGTFSTHKDATQMGPIPGSTALWGGAPIKRIIRRIWNNLFLFVVSLLSHHWLSCGVYSSLIPKNPYTFRPMTTGGASRQPVTRRTW